MKRRTVDNAQNDGRPAILVGRRVPQNLTHAGPVTVVEPTPHRIREQLVRHGAGELFVTTQQDVAQAGRALEPGAAGHRPGRIDRQTGLTRGAPAPDGIEILEGEAERIHGGVTACAHGVGTMLFQPIADRGRYTAFPAIRQPGHVGRGLWRGRSEHAFEQPFAAQHRRGPVGV